jgi:adenine-specific DNA-methyltransferase
MSFEVDGYTPSEGQRWQAGKDVINQLNKDGYIEFKDGTPFKRYFEDEEGAEHDPFYCFMEVDWASTSEVGKLELSELIGENHGFDTVKPTRLLKTLIQSCTKDGDFVCDFFAGSGTTGSAVMATNVEDGCARNSISVQMPEVINEDSEAYKAGYRTIADITRARIDKVISKLKAEHPDKTADLACAHFTLAPSNFKVWRGNAGNAAALRDQLALFQRAEKMDSRLRGNDDVGANGQAEAQTAMLAELLLKHGLGALGVHAISKPKQLAGATVYRVLMPNNKEMWLCFDPYTEALKADIVKAAPAQVVMLNSCFVGSKADELLANLQLELAGLEIGLTVI